MHLLIDKPAQPMTAIVKILEKERNTQTEAVDSPTPEVAAAAKDYIQKHLITSVFEEWLRNTVEAKPENPLEFSITHFQKLAAKTEGYVSDAAATSDAPAA